MKEIANIQYENLRYKAVFVSAEATKNNKNLFFKPI